MKNPRKEEVTLLATKVLGYSWNEELGRWDYPNGFTDWFNPFEINDDCEKLKTKLRRDGWLITLQDKVDYIGDYISSGKVIHKKDITKGYYSETINERHTICYLALKAYGIR